jgi:hypothetical protein
MAGKPTAAMVLCIIGGLLMLGGGLATLTIGSAASSLLGSSSGNITVNGKAVSSSSAASSVGGLFAIDAAAGVICGIIVLVAGVLAYMGTAKGPGRVKMFGAVALVFSLISLINGGGFILGFILGLIGGILALIYKG